MKDAPIEIVCSLAEQVLPTLITSIREGLAQMISEFEVRQTGRPIFALTIEQRGIHRARLEGAIEFQIIPGAWREPFVPHTSRYEGDKIIHAGAYVMGGTRLRTRVGIPAISCPANEMAEELDRFVQFNRIVAASGRHATDLLARLNYRAGELYLAG